MSRFTAPHCNSCGNPLDNIYPAYSYMAGIIRTRRSPDIHPDVQQLVDDPEMSMDPVFRVLRLDKTRYCCRMHLLGSIQPADLEMRPPDERTDLIPPNSSSATSSSTPSTSAPTPTPSGTPKPTKGKRK